MSDVTIKVRANGPLLVVGPVKLIDHLGNEFAPFSDKPNIALCRCGQSQHRPFCDSSHTRCNFQSVELAQKPAE